MYQIFSYFDFIFARGKKKRIIIELQKYKHECTYQNNIPIEK